MQTKITRVEAMDMLMQVCDDCVSMTTWELAFIESCEKCRSTGGWFSQKQLDIIQRIYKEYME